MKYLKEFIQEGLFVNIKSKLQLTKSEKITIRFLKENINGSKNDPWLLEDEKVNNTIYYNYYTQKLAKKGWNPERMWVDKYRILENWEPHFFKFIKDFIESGDNYKLIDKRDNVYVYKLSHPLTEGFYQNAGVSIYNLDEIIFRDCSSVGEFILSSIQLREILKKYQNNIFDL